MRETIEELGGAEMLRRAEIVRAWFKVREGVKGSGWHDDDRNPTKPEIFLAPQRNGFPKASENLVHFMEEFQVSYVGKDALKLADAFTAQEQTWRAIPDLEGLDAIELRMLRRLPAMRNYLGQTADGTTILTFPRQLFTMVLLIMSLQGLATTGAWDEYDTPA